VTELVARSVPFKLPAATLVELTALGARSGRFTSPSMMSAESTLLSGSACAVLAIPRQISVV